MSARSGDHAGATSWLARGVLGRRVELAVGAVRLAARTISMSLPWTGLLPGARAWLRAAALVGLGQQVFVVLRNQYLLELGLAPQEVAWVQGAGGAAGFAAGLIGLLFLRRLSARAALVSGVVLNGAGFALQVAVTDPIAMFAGAAVAGLGIQWLTMLSGPFLTSQSSAQDRVGLFAINALVIHALPGAIGALLAGQVHRLAGAALGSSLAGYRVALAVGLAAVLLGLVPLARLQGSPGVARRGLRELLRIGRPLRAFALLAPDTLVFFGNGLVLPFLQIYFKERFGLAPGAIGGLYAVLMLVGGAGHLLSPRLARRFGTWPVILGTQILSLPLFAELLFTDLVPLAAAAFVLRQCVMNMSAPLVTSLLHTSVSSEDSEALAAYRMLVASSAWASANFVAGPLMSADGGGFRFVLWATMGAYVLAIMAGLAVYPRASREQAQRVEDPAPGTSPHD